MPGNAFCIPGFSLWAKPFIFLQQFSGLPRNSSHKIAEAFLALGIFVAIVALPLLHRLWRHLRGRAAVKSAYAHFAEYDAWLSNYNGYYKGLTPDLRLRFLERVSWFMSAKTFHCVDIEFDNKMPLLISAASVQISFGLEKYLLDFFNTIYIFRRNYQYGAHPKPFQGHVNRDGIYLSWDNFLRGYADYTDADNVGIHEMAHALAFVNFMAGENDDQDDSFIKRFALFSKVARPIFESTQEGNCGILDGYAATNYNEFWAVAMETFFERSLDMRIQMPELYAAMCQLLNQDPMKPERLLVPVS